MTQISECVNLPYSKSNSEESYKVVKFSVTEQESQENCCSNNSSQKDFSQEKL